jgi:hypothetical protein
VQGCAKRRVERHRDVWGCALDGHDPRERPSVLSKRCGKSANVVDTGQGGDTPTLATSHPLVS